MVAGRIAAGRQSLDLTQERPHHVNLAGELASDQIRSAGTGRALVANSAKCAQLSGIHRPGENGDAGMEPQRQVRHHDRACL